MLYGFHLKSPTDILDYLLNFQIVCRKCIYDKIIEDELDCCPVCNTNLGCAPLEKLRSASHSPLNLLHAYNNSACPAQVIVTAYLVSIFIVSKCAFDWLCHMTWRNKKS